jgi:hypothetical protein
MAKKVFRKTLRVAKTFDNKRFKLDTSKRTKGQAVRRANTLRSSFGMRARVVKSKGKYGVYFREGRRRRR